MAQDLGWGAAPAPPIRRQGRPALRLALAVLLGSCSRVSAFLSPYVHTPVPHTQPKHVPRYTLLPRGTVQRSVLSVPDAAAVDVPPLETSTTEVDKKLELLTALKTAVDEEEIGRLISKMEALPDDQLALKDYTVMLGALKRVKGWKRALELLDSMRGRGLSPNEITYNAVMGVCGVAGRHKEAVDVLRTMQGTGYLPDSVTYGALMIAFVRGGQWEKALTVLKQMRDARLELTEGVYTAAIMACDKGGLWVTSLELLREMHLKGIRPSLFAYNAAVFSCRQDRQWVQAIALLGEMQRDGLKPDRVSFHGAMAACEEAGKWEGVMDLFEEMKLIWGIEPSRQSYEYVAKAVREHVAASDKKVDERVREYLRRNSISVSVLDDEPKDDQAATSPPPAAQPPKQPKQPKQPKPAPVAVDESNRLWASLEDDE